MAPLPPKLKKETFSKSLNGIFGRFRTAQSFPLYYLMTTYRISDLNDLFVAAKALPFNSIDFDELVQRDIDYERVDKDLVEKYLEAGANRVVFFPPLLATPLIFDEEQRPKENYDSFDDTANPPEGEDDYGSYVATWDTNKFRLELCLQKNDSGYKIECQSDNTKHFFLNYAATFKYNPESVKMVVIDGQHRLVALRRIIEQHQQELIKEAELPVCIFFSPNAVAGTEASETVLKNMRELFVTINNTARSVSGHFLVLLNDKSLAARCVRSIASYWKSQPISSEPNNSYLHMLEWNQREKSKSYQVNRPYAVTTVSILNDAIARIMSDGYTRTLLNLSEVSEDLRKTGTIDYSSISDERFDPCQLSVLDKQIDKYITPSLHMLFTQPSPYRACWQRFTDALKWLEPKRTEIGVLQFLEEVLFQFRSSQKNDQTPVIDMERQFLDRFKDYPAYADFYRLNIFQQGLVRSWAIVCAELCPTFGVTPPRVAKSLVAALEKLCFRAEARVFHLEKVYSQYAFYEGVKLKVTSSSKDQITNLILATLIFPDSCKAFAQEMTAGLDLDKSLTADAIRKCAIAALQEYVSELSASTTKAINKQYRFMDFDDATIRYLDDNNAPTDNDKYPLFRKKVEELSESMVRSAVDVLANTLNVSRDEFS